jgi:hypothetical protein
LGPLGFGIDDKDQPELLMITGATTIYECEIASGTELRGLQKRKHFAECSSKYRSAIGNRPFSDYVFPALYKVADAILPAGAAKS